MKALRGTPLEHISKSLKRNPMVRALTLNVIEYKPGVFIVSGDDSAHEVLAWALNGHLECDCLAKAAPACAHRYAVRHFQSS
jgi:hypothetical protein